jgi:hypothetical protein
MPDALSEARALNRKSHFGTHDSIISQVVNNARKERNSVHANTIGDSMSIMLKEHQPKPFKYAGEQTNWRRQAQLSNDAPFTRVTEAEKEVKNIASIGFLGRIAWPHLVQPINNTITAGFKATFKAVEESLKNWNDLKETATASGVLVDETISELYNSKNKVTTWVEKNMHLPAKYYQMPFFKDERKAFLVFSAEVGKQDALLNAEKLLQEPGSKSARLSLQRYGIVPDEVIENGGKLTEEQLNRARYFQAERAMFIKSPLNTPQKWEENSISRTLYMYKPFAFNQSRMMKQAIVDAWKKDGVAGAAKVVGTIATLFPAAGELIWSGDELLMGHMPDRREDRIKAFEQTFGENIATRGIDEWASAIAHVGGLGVTYSILRSSYAQAMTNYLAGPFLGWAGEEVMGILNTVRKQDPKYFLKPNLRRIPVIGPAVSNLIYDDDSILNRR